MKNKKGITLISLVITVIVLSILASIATHSGINVIQSAKLTQFTTELKIMQTKVNTIYQEDPEGEYGAEITGDVQNYAVNVFTQSESGITSTEGYRYWSKDYIKNQLGIEGVEQNFFVNIKKRSVISYEGLEYEGKKYYTLAQLPNGLYNVEYQENTANAPTFEIATEKLEGNKWKITVYNIKYGGYIDKWQVKYKLQERENWNTTEDLSFVVNQAGNYELQIVNGEIQSNNQNAQIESTLEEAKKAKKVLDESSPTTVTDIYGNEVKVPEGFKIAEDSATDVTGGVVIEDVSHGATAGSQFVWIPVGTVYTSSDKSTSKTIELNRYTFDERGNPTSQGENVIENYYEELTLSDKGNTVAKDIEAFKTSAKTNKGYYIGRYEARSIIQRTSSSDPLAQVTVKQDDYVYNCVTQPQAALLARGMYGEGKQFTSDLINSYAWDTAIVFLQTFGNRTTPYSRQNSLNTGLAPQGTNHLETAKQDKICNIWDIASNNTEWNTETYSNANNPCVIRGGNSHNSSEYTSYRISVNTTEANIGLSFRHILYL